MIDERHNNYTYLILLSILLYVVLIVCNPEAKYLVR